MGSGSSVRFGLFNMNPSRFTMFALLVLHDMHDFTRKKCKTTCGTQFSRYTVNWFVTRYLSGVKKFACGYIGVLFIRIHPSDL